MTVDSRTDVNGGTRYRPRIRVKDAETGQWQAVYGRWTRSQSAAERAERELHRRRDAGNLAPTRGLTVGRYLGDEWFGSVRGVSKRGGPDRSGFGEVTFHTLRHGTATLLLAAGVPDAVVVTIMGHADTRILRRYQEVVPELMRDAGAKLEALLAE